MKASNSSLLRDAAAAIQRRPKASAKTQASGEPSLGTLSAKNHAPARTQKIAPTHHNSCHADDALMPPSTAASRLAPPRRPRPSVAFLHLVRLWAKEHPSRLQHLR